MKTVVVIAGGFDPFHDGHLDHLLKASRLGDRVMVLVSNNQDMVRKKGKCCLELGLRVKILELILSYYSISGYVLPTIDTDGTQAKTLARVAKIYKSKRWTLLFAKGGDRTRKNMPLGELEVCDRLGVQIVYGIGDKLNSSTSIADRMKD